MRDNEIFYFERGAYFAGTLTYTIEVIEDRYIFKGRAFNDFCWMKDIEFEIPEKEIIKLERLLKPTTKWKRKYTSKDEILDGYGWDIVFKYKDTQLKSSGYEKYPLNYNRVVRNLQLFIERLGVKYDGDYQREGRKERLEL